MFLLHFISKFTAFVENTKHKIFIKYLLCKIIKKLTELVK
jgi:hypothetical protein